jgi:hypothetical protein
VPNGVDKNLQRLNMTCAAYRGRYGDWPSQARLHPLILHDLANLLDEENFSRLATLMELRTRDRMGLSVGGRGVVDVDEAQAAPLDEELLALTQSWLAVEYRRDRNNL